MTILSHTLRLTRLALLAILALAAPASAQTTAQTARIASGEALFEAANYDAALAEFEAVPSPSMERDAGENALR